MWIARCGLVSFSTGIFLGMPKKFQGENSKSVTARARKAEAKAVEDARRQKELEDALWEDNDKHVMKKQQRSVRPVCSHSITSF